MINSAIQKYALRSKIAKSRDRLYRIALAWCGDTAIADDLVQETLMIALQRVNQLRDSDRLNAWMHTILSNCWKQHLRRRRPMIDIEEIDLHSEYDAEAGGSELEIIHHLRRAILNLPIGQRQTITLVDVAGFTYAEVADILDIPIGTVMSRLHTSRNVLQVVLNNFRVDPPRAAAQLQRAR